MHVWSCRLGSSTEPCAVPPPEADLPQDEEPRPWSLHDLGQLTQLVRTVVSFLCVHWGLSPTPA